MPAAFGPLINEDGSVNRAAIYDLQVAEVKAWINRRLSGEDPFLPLGRSEELPHTLLVQLFETADPTHPFRKRLDHATRELLEPVLSGKTEPPSSAWLREILRLAFTIRLQLARNMLRTAFESKRFFTRAYLEADVDIELLDLLAIQEGLEPIEFWNKLLEQPRYSLSAFAALERYGPDAVVQGLPMFIRSLHSTPELGRPDARLALPLKRVVQRFGIHRLLPRVETQLGYSDRIVVQGALHMIGIPLTLVSMTEMKSSDIPILSWPWVRLPTPDEVHKSLSHAAQNYGNWLQANVDWPLEGKKPEKLNWIRVLDATIESMAGHWCSILLAEHGAEVITVEPPEGDPARRFLPIEGMSARSLRVDEPPTLCSITLDLQTTVGRKIFKDVVGKADVLIENYPLGKFDAWEIGYRHLSQMNPRLIYGSIGQPEDQLSSGHLPSWVSDYVRGTFLAMEIIAALNYRERISHRGQFMDAREASGIMRILEIEYEVLPPDFGEETSHWSIWRTFWRPPGHDNVEVYRRLLGVQKDYIDHLKSKRII